MSSQNRYRAQKIKIKKNRKERKKKIEIKLTHMVFHGEHYRRVLSLPTMHFLEIMLPLSPFIMHVSTSLLFNYKRTRQYKTFFTSVIIFLLTLGYFSYDLTRLAHWNSKALLYPILHLLQEVTKTDNVPLLVALLLLRLSQLSTRR